MKDIVDDCTFPAAKPWSMTSSSSRSFSPFVFMDETWKVRQTHYKLPNHAPYFVFSSFNADTEKKQEIKSMI